MVATWRLRREYCDDSKYWKYKQKLYKLRRMHGYVCIIATIKASTNGTMEQVQIWLSRKIIQGRKKVLLATMKLVDRQLKVRKCWRTERIAMQISSSVTCLSSNLRLNFLFRDSFDSLLTPWVYFCKLYQCWSRLWEVRRVLVRWPRSLARMCREVCAVEGSYRCDVESTASWGHWVLAKLRGMVQIVIADLNSSQKNGVSLQLALLASY
jgi:hypothetical protein